MEEEKAEAIKRYNDPFRHIIFVVEVAAVVAFIGYWCFPAIVNLAQVVTVWLDWFSLVLRNIFFVFILVNAIVVLIYVSFSKTTEKNKPDLYDQYHAAVPSTVRTYPGQYFVDAPSVVRTSQEYNYHRVTEVEVGENSHSNYKELVPAFQVVEESNCCDRVVMEVNSKSYRRTRSEKKQMEKAMTKVEYRRSESERVTRTASWRTMDGLSSEEFRTTVETFITEKKKTLLRENGVVDHWQSGFPQWQNGAVNQWLNGAPEQQDGVVQWQGSRDVGSGRHRHRSRSHRLVGGSGSIGSCSYLAISN